jgi:non-specific serine/threonine protein kinase
VLGRAAHDQGRLAQAQALLNESVKLCQEMDNRPGLTYGLTELGTIALDRGNRAGAREHFVQALEVAEKAGGFPHIPRVLEELGSVSATSEPSRAAGLAGAALGLRQGMQAPTRDFRLSPADRARLERWIQVARDALGEPAYTRAWQAGTEWPLEVAIHEAVAVEASAPAVSALDGLTPREREVAALVAEGRTNQQIADQLIFTEATARKHVEHILDKLGFSSRAQIVAWHLTVMHATVEIVSGLDVRPTSPSPAPTRQT